jgi:aspartyl protease family protein
MGLRTIIGGIALGGGVLALKVGLSAAVGGALSPDRSAAMVRTSIAPSAPAEIRLRRRGNGHFFVHGMVDGQIVEFLVDTGASDVVLTVADAARVGIAVDPKRFRIIGSGAGGPVHGQLTRVDTVEVEGRTLHGPEIMIADGLTQSLLGQDFLTRFGAVQMNGDHMVLR